MHMEHLRNPNGMATPGRSASKPQRRESVSLQHQPEMCWQCANGFHHSVNGMHSASPMDPRSVNGYPSYYYSQAPPAQNPPPASPQSAQFQYPAYGPDVLIAHSSHRQRRPSRSTTYHPDGGRPLSYHGGRQESVYNQGALPMSHFEQGPPSAYSSYYTQPSTPRQQYYAEPGSTFQTIYERPRSSMSRPKERRPSIYGRPTVEHSTAKASYEDGSFLERHVSREQRPRRMSQSQRRPEPFDEDEAFYLMPPPPPPQAKPKIIQKRPDLAPKQMSNGSMPPPTNRRMSHSRDSWDMSELKHALPNQQVRPIQGAPERSRSVRTRRTSSYHDSDTGREIAVENPRRRRAVYHQEEPSTRSVAPSDLEQKHRSAEEYQAAKSGRSSTTGVALTEDALRLKTKINQQQRLDSDSGSQKTRSNSSRGSDARTRDGSGVGSRIEDDSSFTMTMHGMTIGFTQESVNGKRIHLRADDNGGIGLNIEGRRPKRYIMPAGSDYTAVSSKKEIEDGRRAREDRRSDRASRRSSRSTYSGRFD
jgi:hypothetical protein